LKGGDISQCLSFLLLAPVISAVFALKLGFVKILALFLGFFSIFSIKLVISWVVAWLRLS
jgi:hypothetical protein